MLVNSEQPEQCMDFTKISHIQNCEKTTTVFRLFLIYPKSSIVTLPHKNTVEKVTNSMWVNKLSCVLSEGAPIPAAWHINVHYVKNFFTHKDKSCTLVGAEK